MDRTIFAIGLVLATLGMTPWDQSIPQRPDVTTSPAMVANYDPLVVHVATRNTVETDLGLDPGSQQTVVASVNLDDLRILSEKPLLTFSATMHNLTEHMVLLPPHSQREVVWLAKALSDDTQTPDASLSKNSLQDNLVALANSVPSLSKKDRSALVDLAASLALR